MEISRRGFLQILAAFPVSAALPVPEFALAEIGEVIADKPVRIGLIRATSSYDLSIGRNIVRLDAYNKKSMEQVEVDFFVNDEVTVHDTRLEYLKSRATAEHILFNEITHRQWSVADMSVLPLPQGYVAPAWMI